jgi:predicted secreted hydrolase
MCRVKNLQYKDGKHAVQVSSDWQYIHLQDLEKFLGLNRVNVRGKDTTKIKALDGRKKVRDCNFVHIKHLESLCMRSDRPVKSAWIIKRFEARLVVQANVNKTNREIIRDLLDNFWTRLPKLVITNLEGMVGLDGFVAKLRAEDDELRAKDEADACSLYNQEADGILRELEEKKVDE